MHRSVHRHVIAAAALCAGLLTSAQAARAADSLPPSVYVCGFYSGSTFMNLGRVEIRGLTYRMTQDNEAYPFHPYQLADNGVILWGGPMEMIESADTKVVSSVYTGQKSFRMVIQTKGAFQEFRDVNCTG